MAKKKILVIDDMPNIVTMLKARLEASGYEVIAAFDGQQGLTYAHAEKPDLIILDVVMPAGGGYSVYSKLKMSARTRSVPVVFLTARDEAEDLARAYKLGAEYFVKKPYKPEILLETVRKALHPPTEPSQRQNEGATWHRLDLHLHGPPALALVSARTTKRKEVAALADAYVEQLAAQGIAVGAITDFNGLNIEWFEVAAAKATNRGMTLLPGVEMAFREGRHSLHVLAIFPADIDLKGLNAYLLSLDKDPNNPLLDPQGSHRDIHPKISLAHALKDLRSRFNCLLVLPHPDHPNGFSKNLTVEAAARLLKEIEPDAVEYFSEEKRKKLQATAVLGPDFWSRLALVEFSNPKRVEEIGTQYRPDGTLRATYLKLSTTHLDALRLALHDPETRLSIGRIPPAPNMRLRSLAISGSGFLRNLNISWNQDLNVIIGSKGAGKSAILESLRYAFAIKPYSDPSHREELVRHALGSNGKVEVVLDRPLPQGNICRYRIARAWGEEPRVFEVDPEKPVSISPSELLGSGGPVAIFGQQEINAVSGSEAFRLRLLDESMGEEARKRAEEVRKARESLTSNAREIREAQAKLAKREDYHQRLKEIGQAIETHKAEVTAAPAEAAGPRSLADCLQEVTNAVRGALTDCEAYRSNVLALLERAQQDLPDSQDPQGGDMTISKEASKVFAILQESLKVVLDDETTLFEQAIQNLTRLDMRCREKPRPGKEENKEIRREGQGEPQGQDGTLRLTEEKASLTSLVEGLKRTEDRLQALGQERKKLLQHFKDCRATQNRFRRERAEAVAGSLHGRLQLHVEPKGQKESYKAQLASLFKGSPLPQDAIDRLVFPEATDGIALAEAVRAGSREVQTRFGLQPELADGVIHWLTADGSRLFELEALFPEDALRLKLSDNGQPRPAKPLSAEAGAALLLLLLGLENRILVIDQPDDYLDNPFVHEATLQILREQKGLNGKGSRCQVILATHDATIPVISDAELVIPVEARVDRAHVVSPGSIDDRSIQELIKTLLQGGRAALQQRAERYGGLAPS